MFSTDCRVLAAFAVATSLAASFSSVVAPEVAHAQATEEGATRPEDEAAGTSRGGYAWGEEGRESSSGPTVTEHRYSRLFLSLGAGAAARIILYENLRQERLAPAFLQLRPGYFFEGEGTFQHGVTLGIATALQPDGTTAFGHDAFGQWVLTPSYMLRAWLDGELGHWLQLTARVGVPVALGEFISWGVEAEVGVIFEFLTGIGLYVEAGVSIFFAEEYHPLIAFEGGLVVEYEVLP